MIATMQPHIVCLQESKLEVMSGALVMQCLGNKFDSFVYLPTVEMRGGIIIACNSTIAKLSNTHVTTHTITVLVTLVEGAV